jgi:DNA mismatch repair protein MutS2
MKRRIKGIIHDESDTGKTVYIEPSEVVEANNKIRELEADERREIQRILLEITNKIRPEVHDIEQNFEFLAEIDFTRAKAKFAINTKSIQPEISTKPEIDWSIAIHPLLEKSLKKSGKSVVPLDIKLTSKNRILLISGPNAGGKSVCLKTVGLLQYMLQCGMPIPVAPSSTAGIFRSIFIDIGDEQSLEDDLSTYSSHLLNMKNMMKGCNGNSLILIDEFGGGTEPQIGGAIAEAILKRFNTTGSYGIITTHYQNLKEYAQNTPGIINGAMLYDRQHMQPLFQLRIGNPGSSFAIEIARKTGIPEEVIADATEIVGKDYISADKYLQDILRDKKYWEKKRESVHKQEKIMNQIISQHETEIQTLQEERKKILTKAKEEAQQLIKDSNAKIERTIKEIKEAQAEKESTKFIRQSLNEFKESIESQNNAEMEDKIQRQMNKILARKERIRNKNKQEKTVPQTDKGDTPAKSITKHTHPKTSFVAGDYVRIKGQNTVGQIKQINNKQAQVTFGMIITNIKINQLEHAEKPETQKRASTFVTKVTQDDIRERKLNFKQDIDVRGMRADEAIQAITYFIDDAIVANVSPVRILHGTGSGILRTILRQHLSTISGVKSFRDEHVDFGGAGITIVNLD